MTTLAPQQKILIPLIILCFAYVLWQLYEEYSLTLIEPSLSTHLLLSSTEKLGHTLREQQTSLDDLVKELNRINALSPVPTITPQELSIEELSNFVADYSKRDELLNTPINWKKYRTDFKIR